MLNLLSGLVSGAGLVILWAVLTKPKRTIGWQSAWFDTKGLQENGSLDYMFIGRDSPVTGVNG